MRIMWARSNKLDLQNLKDKKQIEGLKDKLEEERKRVIYKFNCDKYKLKSDLVRPEVGHFNPDEMQFEGKYQKNMNYFDFKSKYISKGKTRKIVRPEEKFASSFPVILRDIGPTKRLDAHTTAEMLIIERKKLEQKNNKFTNNK